MLRSSGGESRCSLGTGKEHNLSIICIANDRRHCISGRIIIERLKRSILRGR
jgi:hypothetical protein